ncbi:hypothetical protein LCGC14_2657380, partial [marine sediment metagenome]
MSHFAREEDILDAENVGVKESEIGAKRPGKVLVTSHRRGGPYGERGIEHHKRDYPDVWDYSGQWGEVGAEPEKIRTFVKDGNLCTVMLCRRPDDSKLMIATRNPLPPGVSEESVTMGWSPWGSIKKAAKGLRSTVKHAAKKTYQVAKSPAFRKYAAMAAAPAWYASYKAIQNPQVRQFAMQMAPMAGAAFGVPPHITAMATGVLQNAMQGKRGAMGKVQNISREAQRGYAPAVQLRNTMSMLYRGGMQQWGRGQSFPQQPSIPQFPQFQPPRMPWQQPGMPSLPYGMHRFNIPTPGYGMVSGWLYNIPVRGAIQAALESPTLKVRGLYQRGMVGALADDVGIKAYQIGAARPGE